MGLQDNLGQNSRLNWLDTLREKSSMEFGGVGGNCECPIGGGIVTGMKERRKVCHLLDGREEKLERNNPPK